MLINKSIKLAIITTVLLALCLVSNAFALSISGTLRGADGNPVRDSMRVGASSDFENWTEVETGNGSYVISNLEAGGYWVRAVPVAIDSWFFPMFYPNATKEDDAEMVFLFEGDAMGIDFDMLEGGRFAGSIRPEGGGEFPGDMAQIQLFDEEASPFDPLFDFVTDQASGYTSPILAPGDYLVRFVPPPMDDHVPIYYGDVLTPGDATWMTVESRRTTPGVSAELPLGGRIAGTTRHQDEVLPGTYVVAAYVQGIEMSIFGFSAADQNGEYTLYGVPSGRIYLQFIPMAEDLCAQWYRRAYSIQTATPVPVQVGEVTEGIDADLEPGASLSGTILKPDGSPVPQWETGLQLLSYSDLFSRDNYISIVGEGQWESVGPLTPGVYGLQVEFIGDENIAVQFYDGALHPWDAEWWNLHAGENISDIEIRLGAAGTVSGIVENSDREGVPDAELSLRDEFTSVRWNSTSFNGQFYISNVTPGRYFLQATPYYNGEDAIDPENAYLTTFSGNNYTRQDAQWFDVVAGQNTEVNITMGRGGVAHIDATGPDGQFYDLFNDGVGVMVLPVDAHGALHWDVFSYNSGDGPPVAGEEGIDFALPAGSFTFAAVPLFVGTLDRQIPPVRRTYLGGGFDLNGAGRINVADGQTVEAAISVVEAGHSIQGYARTADRRVSPAVTLAVDDDGHIASAYVPAMDGSVAITGAFWVGGLPNGSYNLLTFPTETESFIVSTWYPNIGDPGREVDPFIVPNGAQSVAVNNADVIDVNITMQTAANYNGVKSEPPFSLPLDFELHGAYPNPFNSSAIVFYSMNRSARIKLSLTDVLGREIAVLADGRQGAGLHSARINGETLANGVYFVKIKAEGFEAVTKVVLMK